MNRGLDFGFPLVMNFGDLLLRRGSGDVYSTSDSTLSFVARRFVVGATALASDLILYFAERRLRIVLLSLRSVESLAVLGVLARYFELRRGDLLLCLCSRVGVGGQGWV